MTTHSWMIKSWPMVEWEPPASDEGWLQFRHVRTAVRDYRGDDDLFVGETVWQAEFGGQPVAAAWEWVEIKPGVVAMLDPMAIVSNLCNAAELSDGSIGGGGTILTLNRLAHQIPWQDRVRAALRGTRHGGGPGRVSPLQSRSGAKAQRDQIAAMTMSIPMAAG